MKTLLPIFLAVTAVCLLAAPGRGDHEKGDILLQRNEMEQIKAEVKNGQQRLDSLHGEQLQVSRKITEYDQKISSDGKIIGRLNSELGQLQSDIQSGEAELQERENMLDRLHRRYLGSLRQFYFAASGRTALLPELPNTELEKARQVVYLTALAGFESQNVTQAETLLARTSGELTELSGRSRTVSKLKKSKETSVALEKSQRSKQQRDLDRLQRKSREEADRILTLQKAAEEMEALVARLERDRQRAVSGGEASAGRSLFATLKGQLPPPCGGRIVAQFGASVDPVSRLRSFSPGITLRGRPGNSVRAVAAGTVAYAGDLRGYGNFVIINHDNQYYTTYAGLGTVLVSQGQHVQGQASVGTAAGDGLVKFEIRKGSEPQDPVKWIRFESL